MKKLIEGRDYSINEYITKNKKMKEMRPFHTNQSLLTLHFCL